jgi:guanine deaminase
MDFLFEAIRLARQGVRAGEGGPFGAVVVRDGAIVGRGCNRVTSANDPTAHAEIVAVRDACARLGTFRLDGCVVYASCEPCPMCHAALLWARADRVVYAATSADAAAAGFDDRRIREALRSPARTRPISVERVAHPDALVPFREWAAKPDRTPY